jgi:O-acetyl-ADP-ribose deacetylase (regulator of RNase III)
MIIYRRGDIFLSKAQVLICPVNCVGAMGAGLAKQFKEKSKQLYLDYQELCRQGLQPGGVQAMSERLELRGVSCEPPVVKLAGVDAVICNTKEQADTCESQNVSLEPPGVSFELPDVSCDPSAWSLEMLSPDWEFPDVGRELSGVVVDLQGYMDTKLRAIGQQTWLMATKDHWRQPSQLEWIEEGLSNLASLVGIRGTQSVALPAIGCGYGGLRWSDVRVLIERYFAGGPEGSFVLEVYEPGATGPARRRGYKSVKVKA